MKVEKDFKFLFCSLSFRKNESDEWEWVGKVGEKEIVGESFEDCFERVLEKTEAVEFDFVPRKMSYNEVGNYTLILKIKK